MREIVTNKYPFRSQPRQVAAPERYPCVSQREFFGDLNRFNGIRRKVYYSIYRTTTYNTFDDVCIDQIAFDLDSEKCLENIRKLYEYCKEHDLKSMFMFSTGGFWAFIRTTGEKLQYPKEALGRAQHKVAKDLGFTVGQAKDHDLDSSIIGDIARITRAINTKDINRQRFCIVLRADELYKTYEEICAIAKKPRFEYYIYGSKLLDLKEYDTPGSHESSTKMVNFDPIDLGDLDVDTDIDSFLPCVQSWLTIPERGIYLARYYYAVYMAQTGQPVQVTNAVAKKYFSQQPRTDGLGNNYNHFSRMRIIRQAYKEDKFFPNCDTLMAKGLCPGRCEKYSGQNSPIYYNGGDDE